MDEALLCWMLQASVILVTSGSTSASVARMQAIADNGGALAVAAGGKFMLCLTVSGRVVLWGKLASGRVRSPLCTLP